MNFRKLYCLRRHSRGTRFKETLTDGYFWKRLRNYIMRKSCDWYGCELCSPNPEQFYYGDCEEN